MRGIKIIEKITPLTSKSFRLYLNEIGKHPILTPAEELRFAEKMVDGDKRAEEILITCNLRFVVSVAKLYADDFSPLEDLVNEGNEGLIVAAKRFDPTTGYKFISYAVWWIRRYILEYKTMHARLIRVPSNKLVDANKVYVECSKFEQKFHREPTEDELHELFDETLTKEKFREILRVNKIGVRSLEYELDVDGSTLKDVIPNQNVEETDHLLAKRDEKLKLDAMLNQLKPLHRKVLAHYFGLDNKPPMTLAEIGAEIGLTRERVRQIKEKAIIILKFKGRQRGWGKFYED